MFCPSCGKEINGNEKFCGNCGYVLPPKKKIVSNSQEPTKKTDDSPNYFQKKAIKKQIKHDEKIKQKKIIKADKKEARKQHRKETHFTLKLILLLIVILAVAVSSVVVLSYFHIVNIPIISSYFSDKTESNTSDYETDNNDNNADSENQYTVSTIDAKDYFEKNSTIVNEIEVNKSSSVESETEVKATLIERGFESEITFEYNMNGEYDDTKEVSESNEKHPEYQTDFITDKKFAWMIYEINGCIMAYPVSYCYESGKSVILSEKDTITSYDSATNMFFETKPNDVLIIQVDRIDVETLNSFDSKKIEEML